LELKLELVLKLAKIETSLMIMKYTKTNLLI